MKCIRWVCVCGAFALAPSLAPLPAFADEDWVLRTEHFECLIQNLEVYRANAEPVTIIVLGACPEVDITEALAMIVQNSGIAQVDMVEDSAARPAEIISFTPPQLECLAQLEAAPDGDLVRIPRDPCR